MEKTVKEQSIPYKNYEIDMVEKRGMYFILNLSSKDSFIITVEENALQLEINFKLFGH